MALLQIGLSNASEGFRQGFQAALDFMDGAGAFQVYHSDATSVTLSVPDAEDNNTYVIDGGIVRFDSTGVEL